MRKARLFSKAVTCGAVLSLAATVAFGQTEIKLPKNKYTPEQDVELGMKAAAEVRKDTQSSKTSQLPAISRCSATASWLRRRRSSSSRCTSTRSRRSI